MHACNGRNMKMEFSKFMWYVRTRNGNEIITNGLIIAMEIDISYINERLVIIAYL